MPFMTGGITPFYAGAWRISNPVVTDTWDKLMDFLRIIGAKKAQRVRYACDLGGDEEDRTPGLGIANAALSQLSYIPNMKGSLRLQAESFKSKKA